MGHLFASVSVFYVNAFCAYEMEKIQAYYNSFRINCFCFPLDQRGRFHLEKFQYFSKFQLVKTSRMNIFSHISKYFYSHSYSPFSRAWFSILPLNHVVLQKSMMKTKELFFLSQRPSCSEEYRIYDYKGSSSSSGFYCKPPL